MELLGLFALTLFLLLLAVLIAGRSSVAGMIGMIFDSVVESRNR